MQNQLDNAQRAMIDSSAKLFAEEIGPGFGRHDLDFSVKSLEAVDSCLEQAVPAWAGSSTEKKRRLVQLASAYIVKTVMRNDDQASVRLVNGCLVLDIPNRSGYQTAYIDGKVEKKLTDPENESVVGFVGCFYVLSDIF